MKVLLLISLLCFSTLVAKTLPPVDRVISAEELSPEMVRDLIEGKYPNAAIELKAGSAVPIHFLFKTHFAALECNPNLTMKLTATSYLRAAKRKLYMSEDLVHWDKPRNFIGHIFEHTAKVNNGTAILEGSLMK